MIPAAKIMIHHGRTIREITVEDANRYILTNEALESGFFPEPGLYLIQDRGKFIAIDNIANCAFVEEFDELKDAKRWLIS